MKLIHGDCLEEMAKLESGSVDMVLTDPPYGTINGVGEGDVSHGMKGKTGWDTVLDHKPMIEACNRVLRMNGCLALFSQDPYTGRLMTETHGNLPFSYRLTWLKDHFANSLIAKKAPVNYTEDICVFFKKYDTMNLHPLRRYAMAIMEHIGRTLKEINKDLGHRRAEHFFYVDSTQFGLCTRGTYYKIASYYNLKDWHLFMEFEQLEEINRRFKRKFNLPEGKKYKSNVLTYKKDYTGLHPTQKPVALMEDLIRTYTNEGDTVLDFTMGSGATGVACANTGREFIGIELDAGYFEIARQRINDALAC